MDIAGWQRLRWSRALALILLWALAAAGHRGLAADQPRNLIVLIADGGSAEAYTLARWWLDRDLALDPLRVGSVRTYIADSVIADSAPAATAFATGQRSCDKLVGLSPHERTVCLPIPPPSARYRPLATVLEGARLLGKSTGLVATSRITHATPAAYAAHVPHRDDEDDIMEQLVHQRLDVVLGGGARHLAPPPAGQRRDGEDLRPVLLAHGYRLVQTAAELQQHQSGPVFGLFAASHMEAELDRPHAAPTQPTLTEMTAKALELLAGNPRGFFLMVEGSQIDWACHFHDPAHLLGDLVQFERAVALACEFARRDGQTLVLALSDHSTGGLSIGNGRTHGDAAYAQLAPEALLAPLRGMHRTGTAIWRLLGDERTPAHAQSLVREHWGVEFSAAQAEQALAIAAELKRQGVKDPQGGLGEVFCANFTYLGWTTHGHTGGDVPLFAFGPGKPAGTVDAPEIGRLCARSLGLDLETLNQRLFVEAMTAFPAEAVNLDQTDPSNPLVRIRHAGHLAELPVNRNLLRLDGQTIEIEGVVVRTAPTGRIYLPLEAVQRLSGQPDLPPVQAPPSQAAGPG